LFVTTKLWIDDFGYDAALAAVDTSLGKLGLEHVDLYIPHWPGAKNKGPYDAEANAALRWETWRAMEKIYADKKARAIGVSNYTVAHLKELLAHEDIKVKPMVNQVELHVLLQQTELRKFCAEQGIVVQSYSTLGKGEDRVLRADAVTKIAEEHKKSNAQVLLRWCIQSGIPTIPKSVHDTRIEENADIFDFSLTEANMAALKTIDTETHITWDPTTVP
jgi:diketogulonate reductase-like aldo/keto reductase